MNMITQSTEENQTIQIAKTILEQIKYGDRMSLMAWGASKFIALNESTEYSGGIQFKVNGLSFAGYVKVQLRWADDYTISFVNKHGEVKHQVKGVYCDQLVEVIDWVEGK